jgi:hypothetical protein
MKCVTSLYAWPVAEYPYGKGGFYVRRLTMARAFPAISIYPSMVRDRTPSVQIRVDFLDIASKTLFSFQIEGEVIAALSTWSRNANWIGRHLNTFHSDGE